MAREVNLDKIKESMEFIGLADMQIPIDANKILIDDYEGVERDLCILLVQGYFKSILSDKGNDLNKYGQIRALNYAKWYATRRLSSESGGLSGLVERSKLFMLNDAEKTGWHHDLEYNDVSELLASILEGKEGSAEAYDWKFIVEQLLPAAEHAGIPANDIMRASVNVRKIRWLVPPARELIRRQEEENMPLEEAEETLKDWIGKVVDDNVTSPAFREELNRWRGLIMNKKEPLRGYKIMQPNGKFMICIPTESDREVAMIEQALKNRVDISITGFDWLQEKVIGETKAFRLSGNTYELLDGRLKKTRRKE